MKNWFIVNFIIILEIYCFQNNVNFGKDTEHSTVSYFK